MRLKTKQKKKNNTTTAAATATLRLCGVSDVQLAESSEASERSRPSADVRRVSDAGTRNVSDVRCSNLCSFANTVEENSQKKVGGKLKLKVLRESERLAGGLELQRCCFRMGVFSRM